MSDHVIRPEGGDHNSVPRTCLRCGARRMVLPSRSKDPAKHGLPPPTLWMDRECREVDPQLVRMYDMQNGSFGSVRSDFDWHQALLAESKWIGRQRRIGSASKTRGFQATHGRRYSPRGKEAE